MLFHSLPSRYVTHVALLAEAIHLLLSVDITEVILRRSETLLREFYSQTENLYGKNIQKILTCVQNSKLYMFDVNICSLNFRNLRHLTQQVRNWGLLWTHSCFRFEDKNGHIVKYGHGTYNY